MATEAGHNRGTRPPARYGLALLLAAGTAITMLACGTSQPIASSSSTRLAPDGANSKARIASLDPAAQRHVFGDADQDDYQSAVLDDNDNDDYVATDGDGDRDGSKNEYHDADDASTLGFGRPAQPGERRRVVSLVKSYFAAASAANGAAACSLIAPSLHSTIGHDLSQDGPRYLKGSHGCPSVASKLLARNHTELATYATTLRVGAVRLQGNLGLVALDFKPLPGRQMEVIREGGVWRMYAALPEELP